MLSGFADFYREVYLPDHSAPLNRWVHFLSNVCALACCSGGIAVHSPVLFALGVWFQLGPPYLGHILFEKTHRSIDQSPIYAAVGSWWTTLQILTLRQSVTWGPREAPRPAEPGADRLLQELVKRHGSDLHSFLALVPGLAAWTSDDREAAVAYCRRGGYRVAAGGPLCAPERALEVARAFVAAARDDGCRAVFFGVSSEFVEAIRGTELDPLQIGLAPVWDPRDWDGALKRAGKVRNRLSRARREGLSARVATADELAEGAPLREALLRVAGAWSRANALPPMGFLVTLEPLDHAEQRRYLVVERRGEPVGFAVCAPIYGRGGWLLEDLLVDPRAPAGASEALVDAAMRQLGAEGAKVVSLGLVALAGLPADGGRHPALHALLRASRRAMRWAYDFEGLYRFRRKLCPTAWEPVYLVGGSTVSWWTIRAVLMAFAGGPLPCFGARALWRRVHHLVHPGCAR